MSTLARIKQLMDQREWTLYRLAKESGVLHSTLTNMFNRNNDPSISTLESLCKGFGITMLQFFSNETDMTTTLTPPAKRDARQLEQAGREAAEDTAGAYEVNVI